MDECEYVLLFSDHVWFACYRQNVGEMIATYKLGHPEIPYVFVVSPDGIRTKVDL